MKLVLGPGAKRWLGVDGVKVGDKNSVAGKDLADALDPVRGFELARTISLASP